MCKYTHTHTHTHERAWLLYLLLSPSPLFSLSLSSLSLSLFSLSLSLSLSFLLYRISLSSLSLSLSLSLYHANVGILWETAGYYWETHTCTHTCIYAHIYLWREFTHIHSHKRVCTYKCNTQMYISRANANVCILCTRTRVYSHIYIYGGIVHEHVKTHAQIKTYIVGDGWYLTCCNTLERTAALSPTPHLQAYNIYVYAHTTFTGTQYICAHTHVCTLNTHNYTHTHIQSHTHTHK